MFRPWREATLTAELDAAYGETFGALTVTVPVARAPPVVSEAEESGAEAEELVVETAEAAQAEAQAQAQAQAAAAAAAAEAATAETTPEMETRSFPGIDEAGFRALGEASQKALLDAAPKVGPGRYCSPCHGIPLSS